jgi:uncharacterized protein YlxW (UPF0749 family)
MSEPGQIGRRFAPDFLTELFRHPLDPGYGDAAARRVREGPRPPWRRRGAYLLRILALLVIGFLLAVAYREAVASEPASTRAHSGLVAEVKTAQGATDGLQDQDDRLRRQVTVAQQQTLGGSADQLRQIQQQQAATGLAPVTGSGMVVRLTDASAPIDPKTGRASSSDVNRVLDVDLQGVVNALWAAGAEAIAINGQRLTGLSTIRTAGVTVLVDFRPVTSPYEVSAIGPDGLSDTFGASVAAAEMRRLVEEYGLGFSTRNQNDLRLPAAPGPALRFAHPPAPSPSSPSGSPSPSPSGGHR